MGDEDKQVLFQILAHLLLGACNSGANLIVNETLLNSSRKIFSSLTRKEHGTISAD